MPKREEVAVEGGGCGYSLAVIPKMVDGQHWVFKPAVTERPGTERKTGAGGEDGRLQRGQIEVFLWVHVHRGPLSGTSL